MGEPEGYDPKELLYRVGTFFLLVAIGLLALFLLSESAAKTNFSYFCWGLSLLTLGFVFRSQLKKTYKPQGRFSILQKLKPKPKDDKGKK